MPETVDVEQITVSDLLAVIRRSGLVDVDSLKSSLRMLDLDKTSAEDVLARLIDQEMITLWQSRQLLKGRWKGYFLGKYRLLGELGRGGMAKVFLARHETLRSYVAIKVLSRSRMQKGSMVERFIREARSAAQISHPNIVRVFDVDAEDERHYLVMEYIKGWSLQDLVDTEGVLSYRKAAEFTRQAAEGLARAHESGLIHRDIKPANMLVEDGKNVKISDFGLARVDTGDEDGSLTMQHEEKVLGTADYIAPEQAISSHHIDARADQYSLGYSLYFMLTGQPPFPTGRIVERLTKHCTIEPDPVSKFREDVPDRLLAILQKLTRKRPEERYASMADVAGVLQKWIDEQRFAGESGVLPAVPRDTFSPSTSSPDDEMLTLAPDDDEPKPRFPLSVASRRSETARDTSTKATAYESTQVGAKQSGLEALPEESLLDDDTDVTLQGGNYAFSQLLDELLDDDDAASATPAATGSKSDISAADVHASDVLKSRTKTATRDTQASSVSQALPTDTSGEMNRPQKKTNFFADLYQQMQRGEYPLWILIGAGVILAAILLFVAFSYIRSFEPPDIPQHRSTEGG